MSRISDFRNSGGEVSLGRTEVTNHFKSGGDMSRCFCVRSGNWPFLLP